MNPRCILRKESRWSVMKHDWRSGLPFRKHPLLAAVLCLAVSIAGCSTPAPSDLPQLTTFSGPVMGTRFTVKVVGLPESMDVETLGREIGQQLLEVDALMSTYRADSELSRFNRSDQTDWFDVSPDTAAVIGQAGRIAVLTGGAFDVTMGPVINLWSFGPDEAEARVPQPEQLERAAARTGYQKVEVRTSPPALKKSRADLSIDLSGIAKGFAVDKIAELLQSRGIDNYMVEVGGEIRANGHNREGHPWRIAVESPLPGVRKIHRTLGLNDSGMATSGDYRDYFEKDGVRYCHIIDPRTARPITHKLASASVLAPSCMRADALATGLMVLGPEEGYKLAIREGLAVLFIIKDDTGFIEKMTPEFKAMIE